MTRLVKACLAIMLVLPFVTACAVKEKCDLAVRERVFFGCLERVPKGPENVTAAGNDWDDIVAQCRVTAYHIACKGGW